MNLVLLSGGSGKRLWPLSNDVHSKQFIKLFKNEKGDMESMLQRIYHQISYAGKENRIIVTTSQEQVGSVQNQIGDNVKICAEPCRRDTFPAIVLAVSYLYYIEKILYNDPVVICPVDPFVDKEYFESLDKLASLVMENNTELALMGIVPVYPSEKYGYIIPETDQKICYAKAFKEKPDTETAKSYIKQGALWNSGVFAFQVGYLLEKAHKIINFKNYYDLYENYSSLPKISFDYAIAEKAKNIKVLRFSGEWKDIGTWNTLTEVMEEKYIGNVLLDDRCKNTNIINELDVPVLCMGLENVVVAAGPQGILVSDKESSSFMKPYVEKLDQQVMYAEKPWGSFRILDSSKGSMTIKVVLKKGRHMNYHSHEKRDEVWIIISGEGKIIIDESERDVEDGDVVMIKAGTRHTILAKTDIKLIEVQTGIEVNMNDKKVYNFKG